MFQSTESLYKAIFDSARFTVIATSLDGTIRYCNQYALSLLGYQEDELIGQATPELFHDEEEVINAALTLSEELGVPVQGFETFVVNARQGIADENQWTYIAKDGTRIPILLSVTQIQDEQGEPRGFLGIAKDLREIEQLKLINRQGEERFRRLAEAAFEAISVTCGDKVIDCNDQLLRLMHMERRQLVGQPMLKFVHPKDHEQVLERINTDYPQVFKVRLVNLKGEVVPVEVCGRRALWDDHVVRVTAIRSVRERRELELQLAMQKKELRKKNRQLKFLAMHDELTGLANRRSALEFLGNHLKPSLCDELGLSILLIDVDNFKALNDSFGHQAGDMVLHNLACQMKGSFREADLVARWGGEEFLAVLPETNMVEAEAVAEKLRQCIQGCRRTPYPITISIGVCSTESGIRTVDLLLSEADRALYQAKDQGRNCVVSALNYPDS